jgi:RNA polymerase sigma-70 factor (ECF subfamily)
MQCFPRNAHLQRFYVITTSDEQSLVEQARHDPQAFAALYDRFVGPVFLFALRRTGDRVLAEDITSATFEKALRHLRQYGWKGRSYLAWLYRIAYQQMIHHHRRNYRFVALLPDQPADIDVEQQAQSSLQWRAIVQASQKLSRDDQEVLALRLIERLSSAETADFLGCSPENVYVRLYRALERLRHELEAIGEFRGEEINDPR